VELVGGLSLVSYDLRRTSEHAIVVAMARCGFRLSPAEGVPPGTHSWVDHARAAVAIALFANIAGLALAERSGTASVDIAWAKLVLATLLFATAFLPLGRRALALARRNVIGKDVILLAAAGFTFALGVLSTAVLLPGFPASLSRLVSWTQAAQAAGMRGFETAAALVTFALIAQHLCASVRHRAMQAMTARGHRAARRARRIDPDDTAHFVLPDALARGDCAGLLEGEEAPADLLLLCAARVSERDGRGARISTDKAPGDLMVEGSILLSAIATGRVLRPCRDNLQAQADAEVRRAIDQIDGGPSDPLTDWSRLAAFTLAVGAWAFACFALVVHSLLSGRVLAPAGWASAMAVLIGASPAAFVLAAPAARAIAVVRARAAGAVVKNASALEAMASVDIACFGKTGTVTVGDAQVTALRWVTAQPDPAILAAILSLEKGASHPVGRAIAKYLRQAGVRPIPIDLSGAARRTETVMSAIVETREGVCGRLGEDWIEVGPGVGWGNLPVLDAEPGRGIAWFGRNGQPQGYFELCDALRPGSAGVLRQLWERGVRCRLVTGDRQEAALATAHHLGIRGFGGTTQHERTLHVRQLQQAGSRVLFVGDGIHDRPNLAGADVAVAIAPGALAGAVDAPIVLSGSTLSALPRLVDIGRALRARLRENYVVAALYNAVVMPLAAAGFVTPLQAAALMLLETLLVLANSARLLHGPKDASSPPPDRASSSTNLERAALDFGRDAP
jgi:Cu2+-exporting ATPase